MIRIFLFLAMIFGIQGCPYLKSMSPDQQLKAMKEDYHGLGRRLDEHVLSESSGEGRKLFQWINGPYCLDTNGATVTASKSNVCAAYAILKPDFDNYVASLKASSYPVKALSDFYGHIVRLAFHDAGEVDLTDSDKLGPDGCLSTDDANSGLVEYFSINYQVLEQYWQTICGLISRADYWVLLAKLVLESADPTGTIHIPYQYGRKDQTYCSGGSGRLPSASLGIDEFQRVFVDQMGLTLDDAAILLGAHSLGHVHTDHSGYGLYGSTTSGYLNGFDDTPHILDNNYHYNLLTLNWKSVKSWFSSSLFQWTTSTYSNVVMLTADMFVGYLPSLSFSSYSSQTCGPNAISSKTTSNAASKDTSSVLARITRTHIKRKKVASASTSAGKEAQDMETLHNNNNNNNNNGNDDDDDEDEDHDDDGDDDHMDGPGSYGCTPSTQTMPLTCWKSCQLGNSNEYFLTEFAKAFEKMVCVGYGVPASTTGATASGKLGTLYYLDLDTC